MTAQKVKKEMTIEAVRVLSLHGDAKLFDLPEKAIEYLKNYPWQDSKTAKPFVRVEVSVRYDDGTRIEGQFPNTIRAVEFLKNKLQGLL